MESHWYTASAVFATFSKEEPRKLILVEERQYLVESKNENNLEAEASLIAKREENKSIFECDGVESFESFVGIRKIIEIRQHVSEGGFQDPPQPSNGCELNYSFFYLKNQKDLDLFVSGEKVDLIYKKDA